MKQFKDSLFYEKLDNMRVKCTLCPHICILNEGQQGLCGVRTNRQAKLTSDNYSIITALNLDPIEKKPLYHYFPGQKILSVGSFGCNLFCKFCQNWEISHPQDASFFKKKLEPQEIVEKALLQDDIIGIAYTYNEPIVYYEFMLETARLAKEAGLKNVMVSNGFINPEPLAFLLPYIDAFNIDLKGFTDLFYRKQTRSKIQPVLEAIKQIYRSEKHLELTNLVIPALNDDLIDFSNLVQWIKQNLSKDVPLHLSRYFPSYKLSISKTPRNKLQELYKIAKAELSYVYLGNIQSEIENNTYCSKCGHLAIERSGYFIQSELDNEGKCKNCGETVALKS